MRANEWNMLLKTTSRKNLLIHNSKRERIENDMAEKNEIKLCCVCITKALMSTYYYHFYFFYWWKNVHVFIFFIVKIKILWQKNSIVFQRNKKLLVCVFWHWKILLWIVSYSYRNIYWILKQKHKWFTFWFHEINTNLLHFRSIMCGKGQ